MSTAAPGKAGGAAAPTGGYDVSRPHGKCALCAKPIVADDKFIAALRETAIGFERLDVCQECWPQFDRAGVVGFWRTTMPHAEQKKKLFVDDDVLCELFERLGSATDPGKLNFRFVLGLILMRKRMLVYESSRKENQGEQEREIWVVRFRGRDQKLDLLDPKLAEEQMQDVSRQLGEILNEEL